MATASAHFVVEGSVLRFGERVRIIAQLIEVPADTHMWAQSYEGDLRDTLALQSRLESASLRQPAFAYFCQCSSSVWQPIEDLGPVLAEGFGDIQP